MTLNKNSLIPGETLECAVSVKNFGSIAGAETVQLYLKDMEASVDVPKWQLKGISKISLIPGEACVARFEISPRQMELIDNEGKCRLEPGIFEVYIGGSQPDERSMKLTGTKVSKAIFEVNGNTMEIEY